MTTSNSPRAVVKKQADAIAKQMKAAERGEIPALAALRKNADVITTGVVMDDKIIKITMPWADIAGTTEEALSEFILDYMLGVRETIQ